MKKSNKKKAIGQLVLPEPGTNRYLVVEAFKKQPTTMKVLKRIDWHLQVSTNCIAEALLLVDGDLERDMDWRHLGPVREVLIKAGFYKEMKELVKPAPIMFNYKGKVYYYPHGIPPFDWLNKEY